MAITALRHHTARCNYNHNIVLWLVDAMIVRRRRWPAILGQTLVEHLLVITAGAAWQIKRTSRNYRGYFYLAPNPQLVSLDNDHTLEAVDDLSEFQSDGDITGLDNSIADSGGGGIG